MLAGYLAAGFSKSGKIRHLRRPAVPGRHPVHGRPVRRHQVLQREEGHDRLAPRLGRRRADRHLRRRRQPVGRPGQGRAACQDVPRPGRRHRPPRRGRHRQRHHQGDARGRQVGDRRRHRPGDLAPRVRQGDPDLRRRRSSTSPSSTRSRRTPAGDLGGENYVGTLANKRRPLAPFHDFDSPDLRRPQVRGRPAAGDIAAGTVKVADYLK